MNEFVRQHNWCKIIMAFEATTTLVALSKTLDKHREPGWGARFVFG
ncbi:hypothetical protein VCHA54P501_210067 [Vibrio chagasii]|nr:hypothetical protein VCHA54P501_210067 [Vibrio chagasii]